MEIKYLSLCLVIFVIVQSFSLAASDLLKYEDVLHEIHTDDTQFIKQCKRLSTNVEIESVVQVPYYINRLHYKYNFLNLDLNQIN